MFGPNVTNILVCIVKFIYSEKAAKICEIFPLLLTGTPQDKSEVKISQNFVAFSENMNFNNQPRPFVCLAVPGVSSKTVAPLVFCFLRHGCKGQMIKDKWIHQGDVAKPLTLMFYGFCAPLSNVRSIFNFCQTKQTGCQMKAQIQEISDLEEFWTSH